MNERDKHLIARGFKVEERKGSKVIVGKHAARLRDSLVAKSKDKPSSDTQQS